MAGTNWRRGDPKPWRWVEEEASTLDPEPHGTKTHGDFQQYSGRRASQQHCRRADDPSHSGRGHPAGSPTAELQLDYWRWPWLSARELCFRTRRRGQRQQRHIHTVWVKNTGREEEERRNTGWGEGGGSRDRAVCCKSIRPRLKTGLRRKQ